MAETSDQSANSPESKQSTSESLSPSRKRNPFLEKMRGDIKSKRNHSSNNQKESLFESTPTHTGLMTPELKPDVMQRKTSCLTPVGTGRDNFRRIQKDLQVTLFARSSSGLTPTENEPKPEEQTIQRSRTAFNMPGIVISPPEGLNKEEFESPEKKMDNSLSPLPKSETGSNMKSARSGSSINHIEEHKNEDSDSSSDESSSEDAEENADTLFYPKPAQQTQRRSIFLNNVEGEIQQLKIQLEVNDDPDIHFIQGDFYNYYEEKEIIGEGTTGTVKQCVKLKEPDTTYAVKIVHYRDDAEMLTNIVHEFKNHRKLDHRNIIRVYEIYIDYYTKKIYTIMELAKCKEMFEVLKGLGHYSEAIASHIFKQILNAINYLHIKGVCHRDLKPNNILVSNSKLFVIVSSLDGEIVKIADFNVSKFIEKKGQKYNSLSRENYKMWTYTGTIAFTAPEVFMEDEYTESVDLWSAGVVLYTMLCGYQPFQAEYVNDLIELIKEGKYEFDPEHWDTVSEEAKDLVRHLLDVNNKTRYSVFDALKHPWIANKGKAPTISMSETVQRFIAHRKKIVKNRPGSSESSSEDESDPDDPRRILDFHRKRRSETVYNLKPVIFDKSKSEEEGLCPPIRLKKSMDTDTLEEVAAKDEESPCMKNKSFKGGFQIHLLGIKPSESCGS